MAGGQDVQGSCDKSFTSFSSADYWETRYRRAGRSGAGSRGRLAEFKAAFLNDFVRRKHVETVVEWGCGDGEQAELFSFPRYLGLDVSPCAIEMCRQRLGGKASYMFELASRYQQEVRADLSLSLDVIYHLVEDCVFKKYMGDLFSSAGKFVITYSSNVGLEDKAEHVHHRRFMPWIEVNARGFRLIDHIPNPYAWNADQPKTTSPCDFFVFEAK
jgi:hypothetical protein